MKAVLEFDLTDEMESRTLEYIVSGNYENALIALSEIQHLLRSHRKYGIDGQSKASYEVVEILEKEILAIINDRDIKNE